jgi:hypothetical protein
MRNFVLLFALIYEYSFLPMPARISRLKSFCVTLLLLGTIAAQQAAPSPSSTPCPPGTDPTELNLPEVRSCAPSPQKNDLGLPPTTDPREIVRRSVEIDHGTIELARNYTCQNREVIHHLGKNGEVKSTEIKTYDINFYYGEEYNRLIQKDDKPLSADDQKKEDEKLDKFLAKYRDESPEEREKRLTKEKKQREEGRAFLRDLVNAYDFRLVGEERVDGVDSYVIDANPRPDFKPTQPHADMLKHIKGRMWIEKKNYNWVKVDAQATDTISFGLFLFRIHPDSHFVLEKRLLNNEVWLLRRLDINGGARIALFKNENIRQEDVFSNYKKFVSSVKLLPDVKEIPEQQK